MASLVSPRPTDNLADIGHKRNTFAPQVGVGGRRRLHRALHVKLWERQGPQSCRSTAACGGPATSPVNQLHPGVKRLLQARVGGGGPPQGTLQAAREAGRLWVRWGGCAGHSQGRCPHEPQVSLIPPLAAQDRCLVSWMASSPGSPPGISQVWRNSLKLRRLLLYFCGPKPTPHRLPQQGLSDSWMDHVATPQGHALLRAPRILSICP